MSSLYGAGRERADGSTAGVSICRRRAVAGVDYCVRTFSTMGCVAGSQKRRLLQLWGAPPYTGRSSKRRNALQTNAEDTQIDILIMMVRDDLEGLPPADLPDGCKMCTAAQFDDPAPVWAEVLARSFEEQEWKPEDVRDRFMSKPQYDPEGVFFVMNGDEAVSTAFAWVDDPSEETMGRVHWVGTVPEHRQKGLARTVVISVLGRLKERGFGSAFLETHPPLLPAIRLYFSVGFKPHPRNEEEEAAWEEVMAKVDC